MRAAIGISSGAPAGRVDSNAGIVTGMPTAGRRRTPGLLTERWQHLTEVVR